MVSLLFDVFLPITFLGKTQITFSGNWKTEKGRIIQITKKRVTFVGISKDTKKIILRNVRIVDGTWIGTINSKYRCTLLLESNKLNITIKKGLGFKTVTWVKQY